MAKKRSKRKGGKRKSKKSKKKRQKFIRKISRDGKVSKKEGRRAAKKGISLRKIRNKRISSHRKATKAHNRRGRKARSPLRSAPSYEPLKIKRGAERADFDRQMRDHEKRSGKKRKSSSKRRSSSGRDDRKPTKVRNPYKDRADDLLDEIDQEVSIGPFNPEEIPMPEVPSTIYDQSTRTDDLGLQIGPASDPSKKTGTQAFKRRKRKRKQRRSMRINQALNI